jgi:hypothetical protein
MKPGSNIDNLQPGQSGRCSSWDRSGGNKDFLTIAPGETLVAADIEGPGRITHLWFTGWQHYRDHNNNKQHKLTALNCYLPMPFRKRARIEFVKEGSRECKFKCVVRAAGPSQYQPGPPSG